jgi:hypothetical protein
MGKFRLAMLIIKNIGTIRDFVPEVIELIAAIIAAGRQASEMGITGKPQEWQKLGARMQVIGKEAEDVIKKAPEVAVIAKKIKLAIS